MCLNMLKDICIVCFYYKLVNNKIDIVLDYFVNESDDWLVFLYEIVDMSEEEVCVGKIEFVVVMDIFYDKE